MEGLAEQSKYELNTVSELSPETLSASGYNGKLLNAH